MINKFSIGPPIAPAAVHLKAGGVDQIDVGALAFASIVTFRLLTHLHKSSSTAVAQ